jgi:hypothetical protein
MKKGEKARVFAKNWRKIALKRIKCTTSDVSFLPPAAAAARLKT